MLVPTTSVMSAMVDLSLPSMTCPRPTLTWGCYRRKTHKGRLREGVGRIQGGGIRQSQPIPRRHGNILPGVATFCSGGSPESGINAAIFQMATEDQRCFIMGCYLAPDNALSIERIIGAIYQAPQ